ncbi:hypothetical protein E2C01_021141 [Portunus trituberculatus]|uniref:Uncharacterized protein n=1 Tax=Portunus trituberculatus TaxID=210409 RepID=A0A5B7E3F0_PORTR|nr:hypothetical protein [Portunus trituberculatus]
MNLFILRPLTLNLKHADRCVVSLASSSFDVDRDDLLVTLDVCGRRRGAVWLCKETGARRFTCWYSLPQRLLSRILAFLRPTQGGARLSLHNLASHTCLYSSRATHATRRASRTDKTPRQEVRL